MLEFLSSLSFLSWVLIGLCATFFTLVGNFLFTTKYEATHKRIEAMNIFTNGTEEEKLKQKNIIDRVKIMIDERVGRLIEKNIKSGKLAPLKLKLQQAHINMDPIQHWTQKFIYAMALSALSLVLANPMATIGLGVLGFMLPDINVNDKIKKRHTRLKSELPDFLDLLASTAPSAKNLEDAIRKVCERMTGDISKEFKIVLEEINAGRPTRDSLKDMALRCGVEEIDTLISQINQAEAFGTGVEKTLFVQAEKMRKLKKLQAEIKARKASVLLLLPSMFLLITCLIMIAGPSVVALLEAGSMF